MVKESELKPIQPGFKAQFLEKVWKMDFSELKRPAVLIEIGIISIPLIAGLFGSRRLIQKNRKHWLERKFHTTLNISINTLTKTTPGHYNLKIRTLAEIELSSIIPNPEGLRQIELAKEQTTAENPILPLPPPHHWICYNQVLNHVAAMSRDGMLIRDICGSEAVESDWYVIGLTYEPSTCEKKLRALVVKRDHLLDMAEHSEEYDGVEIVYHRDRMDALKRLALQYKEQLVPRQEGVPRPDTTQLMKLPVVELVVPKGRIEAQHNSLDL